ncbi:secondary thiamine-phosphate synthase enzyme YjbQ [Geoglobus ahangari]
MVVIEVETRKREEVVDITEKVREAVRGKSGIAVIYSTHTTTGLIINEAEAGLMEDIIAHLSNLVPYRAGYRHDMIDSNADAHIKASLLGNSVIIPVEDGRLLLGTWQRILFVELDGPRRRKVHVIVYEAEKG